MNKAIVMGVGPELGLGAQLCRRFAGMGLHVFLAGRTEESLATLAANIVEEGGTATPVVADATDEDQVKTLFQLADTESSGSLELAIYNTGNNTPGRIVDMQADYFERSWRVCCFGGFLFAREAIQRMQKQAGGTLLFTGASASLRGRPNFGAFNAAKAALRTLAQAMAKEYAAEGIHVGHVVIDGPIGGEKIMQRYPEYAEEKGIEGMIDLTGIVDAYEFLFRQKPRAWSFEVDLRTSRENW